MAKNLYVRIKPRSPVTTFWRGGLLWTLIWQLATGLDDATAAAIKADQMLETSDDKPADFDEQQARAAAEAAAAEIEKHGDEGLTGSAILPAVINLSEGLELNLGELVQEAFEASHLSVDGWNGLPQVDRENILQSTLDGLQSATEAANTHHQALISANQTADDLRNQVNTLSSQVSTLTSDKSTLTSQVSTLTSQVSTLTSQKGGLETQVGTLQATVTRLEGELAAAKAAPAETTTTTKKTTAKKVAE